MDTPLKYVIRMLTEKDHMIEEYLTIYDFIISKLKEQGAAKKDKDLLHTVVKCTNRKLVNHVIPSLVDIGIGIEVVNNEKQTPLLKAIASFR